MPLTETAETRAMLDEMDRLDDECEASIVGILQHGIKCGKVKPAIMHASHDIQEAWACQLDDSYKRKRKRIHELNFSWNIAHGLY